MRHSEATGNNMTLFSGLLQMDTKRAVIEIVSLMSSKLTTHMLQMSSIATAPLHYYSLPRSGIMPNTNLFQGFYTNTDNTSPSRQLEHIVNGDPSSHGQPQNVPITTSASNNARETQKPIRAEEQQKSHVDPLKPDKAWSLTEPSLFSYVVGTVILRSSGSGAIDRWLTEMDA